MKIAAVVLTYRRRRLLLECLEGLGRQTRRAEHILVVDNAGEADLPGLLRERFGESLTCLSQPANGGPAGGYAAGTEWAWRHGFDWAWLMDDDCEPFPDALERLIAALEGLPDTPAVLAACHVTPAGRVVGTAAGTFDWRRCRLVLLPDKECGSGVRKVDAVSSSGMFVNLSLAKKVGAQDERLFLLEDADFSWRMGVVAPLFHVGASRLVRKIGDNDWLVKRRGRWRAPAGGFWRSYYTFRNDVRFYRRARPGARTTALWAWRYLHALAGIFLLDDRKLWRAAVITRAFRDGLAGRLGKTFDPQELSSRP